MKKYFAFTLWGLTAFFALTFLIIYILFAPTKNEEIGNDDRKPSELTLVEEDNNEESSDDEQSNKNDNQDKEEFHQ